MVYLKKWKLVFLTLLLTLTVFVSTLAEEEETAEDSDETWTVWQIAESEEELVEYLNSEHCELKEYLYREDLPAISLDPSFAQLQSTLIRDRRICYHYLGNGDTSLSYISMMTMDGALVYCLDPYALLYWDNGQISGYWSDSLVNYWTLSTEQKKELALTMYYGYGYGGDWSDEMFVATQLEVWRVCGFPNESCSWDVSSQRASIQSRLSDNPAQKVPSFDGQTVKLTPGKTETLTDTKATLNYYSLPEVKGISLGKNGNNQLNITLNDADDFARSMQVDGSGNQVSTVVIWQQEGRQTVAAKPTADPAKSWSLAFELDTVEITIQKSDSQSGSTAQGDASFSNAVFRISGNGYDKEVSADASGKVVVSGLPAGKYTVTEVRAPKGYLLNTQSFTVDTTDGQAKTLTVRDDVIQGRIRIEKQIETPLEDKAAANFVFDIYLKSTGALVETLTTDENGMATSSYLPYGTYLVKEREKEGFILSDEKEITVSENDVILTYALRNEAQKVKIEIIKKDAEGKENQGDASLEGAVFGLYYQGELLEELTSDENGIAESASLYPVGYTYTLQEIKAPQGYLRNDEIFEINIADSATVTQTVTVEEQVIKGSIRLAKEVIDAKGNYPGADFVFEIRLKSTGALVETLTTDAYGFAESSLLPYGTYIVHEVSQQGYYPLEDFEVVISEEQKKYSYILRNEKIYAGLTIYKVDRNTNQIIPAAGVSFKLQDAEGNYITQNVTYPKKGTTDVFVTDESGSVHLPEVLYYGTYTVSEIQAPYGYVLSDETYEVVIDGSVDINSKEVYLSFADEEQMGVVEVEKKGEVLIGFRETDSEYGKIYQPVYEERYLDGVTYQIRAAEDIVAPEGTLYYHAGEVVCEFTTEANKAAVSDELHLGKYELEEIATKEGYLRDTSVYPFEIAYSSQEVRVNVEHMTYLNQRQKAALTFTKQLEDSLFVEKADAYVETVFGLFNRNEIAYADGVLPKDSLLGVKTVTEDGSLFFEIEHCGDYYLKELSAHKSYQLSDREYDFSFAYNAEEGEVVALALEEEVWNTLKRGSLAVYKVDEYGNYASGSVFEISSKEDFSEIIAVIETNEDGIARAEDLEIGTYYIREVSCDEIFELETGTEPIQILFSEESSLRMMNYYKPVDIEIFKTDDVYGTPLNGAGFELYKEAEEGEEGEIFYIMNTTQIVDLSDYFDDEAFSITSICGRAMLNGSKICFSQPSYCVINGTYTLISDDSEVIEGVKELYLKKEARAKSGEMTLRISDKYSHRDPLAGYQVSIYTDATSDEAILQGVTDAFGCITFYLNAGTYYYDVPGYSERQVLTVVEDDSAVCMQDLMQDSVYYLIESELPEGYAYENVITRIDTSEAEDNVLEVHITNLLRRLTLEGDKIDPEDESKLLDGAVFEVWDEDDSQYLGTFCSGSLYFNAKASTAYLLYENEETEEVLYSFVTDENGFWHIEDIAADEEMHTYYIKEMGSEEVRSVHVKKGAFFIEDVLYGHTLRLHETKAPAGYQLSKEDIEVKVTASQDSDFCLIQAENRRIVLYKMGSN